MRLPAARRLKAFILAAVLLVGGSGASALDVALYHFGGPVEAPSSHRIAGTDAPRSHGDACALLDWAARGAYTFALDALPRLSGDAESRREPVVRLATPRPTDPSVSARPRAPPVHLT